MSRKSPRLPVEGEVFFLTSPFIDQAITLRTLNECYGDVTPTTSRQFRSCQRLAIGNLRTPDFEGVSVTHLTLWLQT
jgi:hypothetical protein